jgi:hypothetical protein
MGLWMLDFGDIAGKCGVRCIDGDMADIFAGLTAAVVKACVTIWLKDGSSIEPSARW